ncbi:MAG: hypothetical protein GXO85_16030, partial [Chlorobi bacterium]|nr:hypothetical protein [Chlorobiota bacterium]
MISDLSERIESEPIKYKMRFANVGTKAFPIRILENSKQIYSGTLSRKKANYYTWGTQSIINAQFTGVLPDNRSVLKMSISASSPDSKAYIDYFEIEYKRNLIAQNDEILFFAGEKRTEIEYQLKFASTNDIKIFDVTNSNDVKQVSYSIDNDKGIIKVKDREYTDGYSKFLALSPSKYKAISKIEKVDNSNIH